LTNAFLRQLNFEGRDFDSAIRLFLSKFMLPGEAQKIDRVMEMFAQRYYSQNPGSFFANGDTCYVLAFAVIMLNTDLHNPAIKREKKMSKPQWQQHVRGINDGQDLPLDFVNDTYERIRVNEIKMESETNMFGGAGKKGFCQKQGGKIRTWKRRYFVLSDHQLLYFRKPTDLAPLGIIPLENLVVDREEKIVKNGFRLSSTDGGNIKAVRMMGGDIRAGNHTFYVIGAPTPEECRLPRPAVFFLLVFFLLFLF
jgi:cytohesin